MGTNTLTLKNLRLQFFSLIWVLLLPLRIYLKYFPIQRGKGILLRNVVLPCLPPVGAEYDLTLPGDAVVRLQYRETLGLSSLLYGTFEKAELNFASRFLKSGDHAFDIGANIGIFSVVMGQATARTGCVIAFEPVPANTERLKLNLERNHLKNVKLQPIALGRNEANLEIHLAEDAAYHSFGVVEKHFRSSQVLTVRVRRLDDVWREIGAPKVALIKIDVEGSEDDVLQGGMECLTSCKPIVLIEANTQDHLSYLQKRFFELNFICFKPDNFVSHNYLFHPAGSEEKILAALK